MPVEIPRAGGRHRCALLRLSGGGVTGLGEAPALAARGGDLGAICAELRERRPRHPAAHAAWAAAELDLRGRAAGVPVASLLGGARRPGVACCRLVAAVSPRDVAREVEAGAAAGYRTFKLKAVAAGGAPDRERLGAARWAAGVAGRLRLDFNGALTPRAAAGVLRTLAWFRLELVEQPVPPDLPVAAWQRLAGAAPILLAADESLADPGLASGLAAAGVALAMKLATVGGPRAALDLARAARGPVLLGSSYETSVGLAAAVHVACALETAPLECGLATRDLLEADLASGLPEGGAGGPAPPGWRPEGGSPPSEQGAAGPVLRLPAGPGLGVELDHSALQRYRLD